MARIASKGSLPSYIPATRSADRSDDRRLPKATAKATQKQKSWNHKSDDKSDAARKAATVRGLTCEVPDCGKLPATLDGKALTLCLAHFEAFVSGRLRPGDTRVLPTFPGEETPVRKGRKYKD